MHPTHNPSIRPGERLVVVPVGAMCPDCGDRPNLPQSDDRDPVTGLCRHCAGTGKAIREERFERPAAFPLWPGWRYADDLDDGKTDNPDEGRADVDQLTPAQILRRAAAYLQRYGFHQGDMFVSTTTSPNPAACAQGAVKMAICGNPYANYTLGQAALFDLTMTVLAEHLGMPCYWDTDPLLDKEPAPAAEWVADWNDDRARTAEQVITAMTATANDWDHIRLVITSLAISAADDPDGDRTQDGAQ